MKCLVNNFVGLARSAHREAMIYKRMGGKYISRFNYWNDLSKHYMCSARRCKADEPIQTCHQ